MIKDNDTAFVILLVEPKYSGNIGAVARAMMNFNVSTLYLVNPCELNDEAYARAMHAKTILDHAQIFSSFDEAIKDFDYLAATSSITAISEKKFLRNSVPLCEFSEKIKKVKGRIGLVFGREDYGLYNQEITACDILLNIPTSNSYLSLNLSHAVAIVLFSLYQMRGNLVSPRRQIGKNEREKLQEYFQTLLVEINYPQHKREKTAVMFKRLLGRSMPSTWEYHTLMGVLSKALEKIRRGKR